MGEGLRSRIKSAAAGIVVAVAGLVVATSAFASGDANVTSCPTATEASPGFRIALPDCRAYELVSQGNSDDAANVTGSYGFPEGVHVYYKSFIPVPAGETRSGAPERFLATRTPSGWVPRAISLPQGAGPAHLTLAELENAEGVSFTSDFANAFVKSPYQDPAEEPQLNQATGMGTYGISIDSGAVSLLSVPDTGVLTPETIETPAFYAGFAEANDWGAFLAGGSSDGSRAFFVTTAKLTTAAGTPADTHESSNEIYERTNGHTYLVGVLPDGSVPKCGAEVGQGVPSTLGEVHYSFGAIAPSGANVVFSTPGPSPGGGCSNGGLYLRNTIADTTTQLPGGLFGGRTGTGAGEEEKIFTIDPETGEIYEYHVDTRQATEIGVGDLLTYSPDGSHVFFVGGEGAIFAFAEGKPTKQVPGTQSGSYRAGGINSGGLIEDGATTDYTQTSDMPVATPDGSRLLFIDTAKLTSYENAGHEEVYVYDTETEAVTCASCNPTAAPAKGQAQLIDDFSTDAGEQQYQTPSPPLISNDGSRVVFETTESLAPQDTNGIEDVYEWEREGTTGCDTESLHVESLTESPAYSPVDGGCVYLLSSGLGVGVPSNKGIVDGTHLVGASEGLTDIYMQTSESLLPGTDNASKLYDVRVDGGFPSTEATFGCEPGQCRTEAGAPASAEMPASVGFAGPGNLGLGASLAKHRHMPARLSRKRRLARALRACRHRRGKRRVACERTARRRYGV